MKDFWQRIERLGPNLALLLILAVVFAVYQSAVKFGFIWDDPVWYGHALGKTWWQTLLPSNDPAFQYFRPFSMLYVWLFMRDDGSFAIEALHILQIGYHFLNIGVVWLLARWLGLRMSTAVSVAALFALYPFSYQAVAWAAPNQPMAALLQTCAILLYIWIRPLPNIASPSTNRRILFALSLLLFFFALIVHETSVAVAGIPLLYEFVVRLPIRDWTSLRQVIRTPRASGWMGATVYLLMGVTYFIIWLLAPRLEGVTSSSFQADNIFYIIQGFIAPVITKISGYEANADFNRPALLLALALTTSALLLLARWRQRGRIALFGLLWAMAAILPFLVGLNFVYVSYSARLFYTAAAGVALLWGCALWPTKRRPEPLWLRMVSIAAVLLICVQSLWVLHHFEQLWAQGTAHLNTAVSAMTISEANTSLFLNFPDQYTTKQEPYPVGYWGMVLAPVVVDLADFVPVMAGEEAQSLSQAMPWIDLEAREASPLRVDMRGTILQANEMVAIARAADAVYLTRYDENGRFTLHHVGSIAATGQAPVCTGVLFGDVVCLHEAQVEPKDGELELITVWSVNAPPPPTWTLFAHYGIPGQAPLAQADGDTWGSTTPLTAWPLNTLITDRRTIPVVAPNASLHIGLYDWMSGERVTAVNTTTNEAYPENSIPVWPEP